MLRQHYQSVENHDLVWDEVQRPVQKDFLTVNTVKSGKTERRLVLGRDGERDHGWWSQEQMYHLAHSKRP